MNIYKTYFKIVKRNKYMIFLMLFVSIVITYFIAKATNDQVSTDINPAKIKVAYIKKDNSTRNNTLVKYLDKTFKTSQIKDDKNIINDTLYYQSAQYIVVLDKNISSYQQPNSAQGYIVSSYINNFSNTYDSFLKTKKYNEKEVSKLTLNNLALKVKIETPHKESNESNILIRYFNIYVYGLVGSIIIGVGYVIAALDKEMVLKRTLASSFSLRRRNIQILLGHISLGLFAWTILSLISIFMFKDSAFSKQHLILLLNSFIFLFPITALAFMISQLVKNYAALSGINNVITLGFSFISGAFVPQFLLSPVVLKVASFTPAYWFVLNNDNTADLYNNTNSTFFGPIMMQLGFAFMFVCIGLAITRYKQKNYSQ
ncbi:MAG: ABC transporter permease [Erysipelotrichales bacterium]